MELYTNEHERLTKTNSGVQKTAATEEKVASPEKTTGGGAEVHSVASPKKK